MAPYMNWSRISISSGPKLEYLKNHFQVNINNCPQTVTIYFLSKQPQDSPIMPMQPLWQLSSEQLSAMSLTREKYEIHLYLLLWQDTVSDSEGSWCGLPSQNWRKGISVPHSANTATLFVRTLSELADIPLAVGGGWVCVWVVMALWVKPRLSDASHEWSSIIQKYSAEMLLLIVTTCCSMMLMY